MLSARHVPSTKEVRNFEMEYTRHISNLNKINVEDVSNRNLLDSPDKRSNNSLLGISPYKLLSSSIDRILNSVDIKSRAQSVVSRKSRKSPEPYRKKSLNFVARKKQMAAIDHENMRLLKKLHSSVASVSFKKLDKEYMKHVRDLNIRKKSDNIVRVANFSKDPKYKITYQRKSADVTTIINKSKISEQQHTHNTEPRDYDQKDALDSYNILKTTHQIQESPDESKVDNLTESKIVPNQTNNNTQLPDNLNIDLSYDQPVGRPKIDRSKYKIADLSLDKQKSVAVVPIYKNIYASKRGSLPLIHRELRRIN